MAAELHIFGTIIDSNLSHLPDRCTLGLETSVTSGPEVSEISGTSTVTCIASEFAVWNQPFEICMAVKSANINPRLHLRLLVGQNVVFAEGSCSISIKAGLSRYTCKLARPELGRVEHLTHVFLHEPPPSSGKAMWVPCGTTNVEIYVITRNLNPNSLET